MARNHNDDLPAAPQNQAREGQNLQRAGNTYDVTNFPRLFGDSIGRRIGTTLEGGNYFTCLVKYASNDEFQVEILVQRSFIDPNYNSDIRLRTSGVIVITMRYEGRIDGIDQFAMKGLETRTWTVGLNSHGEVIRQRDQCPNYDIGIFGVSEERLRRDYGTFFRLANADSVEAEAGLLHQEELTPSHCLTIPGGCR